MENTKGTYLIFVVLQCVMLLIVYGFVYTSFVAVKVAIVNYHVSSLAYFPVVLTLFGYPWILYRSRRMFQAKRGLRAVGCLFGWASVIIVGLYAFLSQLIAV